MLGTRPADGHEHGKLGLSDIAVLYRTHAKAGPLAPGLCKLSPTTWPWLAGNPAQLVDFIGAVIGIPVSGIALSTPVIRRAMSRHAEKPGVQSGVTRSLARPRKTGAFVMAGPSGRYALSRSASSPLTTITWKSEPEWYEVGLSQPTPWDGQARGGFAVYPGGL